MNNWCNPFQIIWMEREVKGELELSVGCSLLSATCGVRCVFGGRRTSMFIWSLYQAQTKHLPYLLLPPLLFSLSLFLPPYLFFWRGSMPLNTHNYQRQSRKARGSVWGLLQRSSSLSLVSVLYVNKVLSSSCLQWLLDYVCPFDRI